MEGIIKKMDRTYPVTVLDAVAVGDGTATKLPEWLRKNYIQSTDVSSTVKKDDAAPVSGAAVFDELEKKITVDGERGQLPICNGDGTITWTTLEWAEEGEF